MTPGRDSDSQEAKRSAGRAAIEEVRSGMALGLGTGSTVRFFLEALGEALSEGRIADVRGVPTSSDTEEKCRTLGIPVIELGEGVDLDLAVDGADEVTPELDLIKGMGGALLREKIVVQAARRFVVIADSSKEVKALGERSPLPVEVVPFALRSHLTFLRSMGAEPVVREDGSGGLVTTDNGNHIVDLHFHGPIRDPRTLDRELHCRAGVVETGMFLGMADRALIGTMDGVVDKNRLGSGGRRRP